MESSTDEEIPCAVKNSYYCGKVHCFHNVVMISVPIRNGSKVLGNCYAVAADYFEVFGIAGCFAEPRIVDNYVVVGCFEVLDIADYFEVLRIADNFLVVDYCVVVGYYAALRIVGYYAVVRYCSEPRIAGNFLVVDFSAFH